MDNRVKGVFSKQGGKKRTVGQVTGQGLAGCRGCKMPVNGNYIMPVPGKHRTDMPSNETVTASHKYHFASARIRTLIAHRAVGVLLRPQVWRSAEMNIQQDGVRINVSRAISQR